jgi:hypothetical protein
MIREKLEFPQVNNSGFLNVETVNLLSFSLLSDWIERVIRGRDLGTGSDLTISPYYFLKEVYTKLDPYVREAFHDAVIQHLSNFTSGKNDKWGDECIEQLLLLVGAIFKDSPKANAPIELLLYIVNQEKINLTKEKVNFHKRALQTLVTLGHKGKISFWIEQFKNGGDEYAMITFSGLTLINIDLAFEWIKSNMTNSSVITALFRRLPLLVQKYSNEKISSHLRTLNLVLPETHRVALYKHAERLGIDLLSIFNNWTIQELLGLAKELKLDFDVYMDSALEVARFLEKKAEKYSAPSTSMIPDLQVLDGIANIVGRNQVKLSPYYVNKLDDNIELIRKIAPKTDDFILWYDAYLLKMSGENPKVFIMERILEIR